MIVRTVPSRGHRYAFADAAPAVLDTATGETRSSVSITADMSTFEVFLFAGIATHIAVKLIDKIWR